MMEQMLRKIAVIGAGNIGSSVTVDLLLHNLQVVLVDVSDQVLEQSEVKIQQEMKLAVLMAGKSNGKKAMAEQAFSSLTLTTDLKEVASCDFIIENIVEVLSLKENLYRNLDRIVPQQICFGVNTSCISISKLAGITKRPDKVVGVHFMNPVNMMPTVEVMRGVHTSDETLSVLNQLLTMLGKEAIVVEDFPGFVSNRISHLFMNEAAFVLQDQVASARDIDNIFKKCFHHKMGPLETADLIGLDTVMKSIDVLYESYHDPKFRCCPTIRKMVAAGHLGRKSGKGFYEY